MNVLFYMRTPGAKEDALLGAVAPFVSGGSLEVFTDLRSLAARIRKPKDAPSIAVVYNPNAPDLGALVSMRELLRGVRVLLVLPDEDEETITLAHRVRPAYITYIDDGPSGIVSVLKRLAAAAGGSAAGGCRR